jgi:4-amino-4-deoxy-L-arabinose transferase-like glycosyltransferase
VLAAAGLVLGAVNLHPGLNEWGGDNATYLCLADALLEGRGYVDAAFPDDPGHLRYPPGFPVLLAGLQLLGLDLLARKAVLFLLALGGLHLTLELLRRHLDPRVALLAVLATLVSGVFLDPALSVLSDGAYSLLATGALLVAEPALREPGTGPRRALLAGLLVGLATLVRTVGVVLGPGLVLLALLPAPRPLAARLVQVVRIGVVALALAGPWLLHTALTPRVSPYFAQLATVAPAEEVAPRPEVTGAGEGREDGGQEAPGPARESSPPAAPSREKGAPDPKGEVAPFRGISGGGDSLLARPFLNVEDLVLRAYHLRLPASLASLPEARQHLLRLGFASGLVALGLVALLGCLRGLVVRRSAFDATTAAYLLTLSFWVGGGPRLLMPVLPFLLVWIADGLRLLRLGLWRLLRRATPTQASLLRQDLVVLGAVLLLQAGVTWTSPGMRNRLRGSPEGWWGEQFAVLSALGELAEPDDLVFSRPNNLPYLLHDLEAARVSTAPLPPPRLLDALERSGARWVIDSPCLFHDYRRRVKRTIEVYPERFELRHRKGKVRLYELLPPSGD